MKIFVIIFSFILLYACTPKPYFENVSSHKSGIDFINEIQESDSLNILLNEYIYNGGGVAVADFNLDGLEDLFFTGNVVDNELYLNLGELKFKAIGQEANIQATKRWSMGATTVDINQDGWIDIYVSVTANGNGNNQNNILFVNQGLDENGTPYFIDEAQKYGLDHDGHSVNSYFFDYDHDGDLDVYVINNFFNNRGDVLSKRKLSNQKIEENINRLFRNDNGNFVDVTEIAGLLNDGFSLSAVVMDANNDGWEDLFVSNDFVTSSTLFVNQQNGKFKEDIDRYFQHQSFSSMGVDVVDVDNNLEEDVITLDMLPRTPQRIKQMFSKSNFMLYDLLKLYGESPQYMRNCFYTAENSHFREIGQYMDVHDTDWSWSPVFADFDNDGLKDLSITNGFPRDLTDLDFINYRNSYASITATQKDYLDQIPRVKISNVLFQNKGQHLFKDVTNDWNLHLPSFSSGQAVSDLDLDGDLELIVSNINDKAFIYKNLTQENHANRFVSFILKGPMGNREALHAKISIYCDSKQQQLRLNPYRGYLSSQSRKLHFGVGETKVVDSIVVDWNNGKFSTMYHLETNTTHKIDYNTLKHKEWKKKNEILPLLKQVNKATDVLFRHKENKSYDFFQYELQQRVYTNEGPALVVGDINGDGEDDFLVSGARGQATIVYVNQSGGTFLKDSLLFNTKKEVTALHLFDIDADKDLDLYVGFGHNGSKSKADLQDELYINDGKGKFEKSKIQLPEMQTVTSQVISYDFDKDDDDDLFVASRVIPDQYPLIPKSYFLENRGGKLFNISGTALPNKGKLGRLSAICLMPTSEEDLPKLLFTGDWDGIHALVFVNGKFELYENYVGEMQNGLWNSLEVNDLDGDGDMDIVAGNYGKNTPHHASARNPFQMSSADLNGNEHPDPLIFNYLNDAYYPIHLRTNFLNQLQHKKRVFNLYKDYGAATFEEIYNQEEKKKLKSHEVQTFNSTVFENTSEGFVPHHLPTEFQFSPIFSTKIISIRDKKYIIAVGNDNMHEVFSGPKNGMLGEMLEVKDNFEFKRISIVKSGLHVPGSAKQIEFIKINNAFHLLISQNNDSLQVYKTIE